MRRAVRVARGRGCAGGRRRGGGGGGWLPGGRPLRRAHHHGNGATLPHRRRRVDVRVGFPAPAALWAPPPRARRPAPVAVGGGGGGDGGGNPPPLSLVLPVPAALVALLPPAGTPPADPLLATAALSTLLTIAAIHAACAALTRAFPAVAALRVPPLHVAVTPAVALLRTLAIHDGAQSVVSEVLFSPLAAAAAAAPPHKGAFEKAAAGTVAGACLLRLQEAAAVSAECLLASVMRLLESAAGEAATAGTPSLRVRWRGARRCARRPVGRPGCRRR